MPIPPKIRVPGRSIPRGYIVGRTANGTGDQQLIDNTALGQALVAAGVVSPPAGSGVGMPTIANNRILANVSGAAATPVETALTQPAAGLTITGGSSAFTFALGNDLAALEGLGSTGFAARTATDTWAQRSLAAPAAGFTITNPAGVAGNPTFVLADDLAALEAMGGTGLVARTAANTYAQRTFTPPAAGISVTNGDGVAGDPTLVLANDLAAVEGLAGTGVAVRTGASTWTNRTITGTANRLTVTNGDGVAGDPALDLSTSYVGQATITTLGTIGTGTWQGTKIGLAYGGTNADLSATGGASQVVKQASVGAALTVGQLGASDLSGGIATANGILKGDGAGAVTAATFEADFGLPTPHVDLDFTTGIYWDAPNNPANPILCTRASTGYIDTAAGVWSSVAANTLRRSDKGTLIEEARTNSLRNNSTTGAVAGSPGTLPTNWSLSTPTGLTRTIALGTTNGIEYIEINWVGTAGITAQFVVNMETTATIAALNGDVWTVGFWWSNAVATGIGVINGSLVVQDSGGATLTSLGPITGLNGAAWGRLSGTSTITDPTAAFIRPRIATATVTSGTVVNFTLRIGWPQLEIGTGITSPIRTTSAAVTRAADVVSVNLPATFGASYTLRGKGTPNLAAGSTADQYLVTVSDGTSSNRWGVLRLATTGIPNWILNSTKTGIGAVAWAQSTSKRVAATNAVSSQAGSFDGAAVTTGSSATSPTGLTVVSIGNDGAGAGQFNGYVERILIWPGVRLGNQAVTSTTAATITGQGYASSLNYGTTINDNAAAGHLGEFQSSVVLVGSAIALTTATPANVTSLSLTAGDWDVDGEVWYSQGGTTVATQSNAAIHTTSATLPTVPAVGTALNRHSGTEATGIGAILSVGLVRISIADTTTVYLVAQSTFTISINAAYGKLRARRVR